MADLKKQQSVGIEPLKNNHLGRRQASSLASFFFFFACYIRFNIWKMFNKFEPFKSLPKDSPINLYTTPFRGKQGDPKAFIFGVLEGFQPCVFRGYVRGCTFFHEWIFQGHPRTKFRKLSCLLIYSMDLHLKNSINFNPAQKGCTACFSCTPN